MLLLSAAAVSAAVECCCVCCRHDDAEKVVVMGPTPEFKLHCDLLTSIKAARFERQLATDVEDDSCSEPTPKGRFVSAVSLQTITEPSTRRSCYQRDTHNCTLEQRPQRRQLEPLLAHCLDRGQSEPSVAP
jgi:hypothetical protein